MCLMQIEFLSHIAIRGTLVFGKPICINPQQSSENLRIGIKNWWKFFEYGSYHRNQIVLYPADPDAFWKED